MEDLVERILALTDKVGACLNRLGDNICNRHIAHMKTLPGYNRYNPSQAFPGLTPFCS